jgi:hypothetical protein
LARQSDGSRNDDGIRDFNGVEQGSAKICMIYEIYFQKYIAEKRIGWYVATIEQSASNWLLSVCLKLLNEVPHGDPFYYFCNFHGSNRSSRSIRSGFSSSTGVGQRVHLLCGWT